jgi:hypothetical protein
LEQNNLDCCGNFSDSDIRPSDEVFKWALRNDFYTDKNFKDCLYEEGAENGHIKILELADRARTNLELLDFILNKKPTEFNLSFTRRMYAREGFVAVMEWWKQMELIELFWKLHIVDNGEYWIVCMRMNINKHPLI